jgi:serine/threonine-protein kinase
VGVERLGGRYRLVERLGDGGMSVVWRAYDEVLGRPVAVKVLAGERVRDAESRSWIRAEAKAAARLSHPHISGVYDYGEARGDSDERVPYVVMELVAGPTLAQRLEEGPLPVRTALLVCAQVAAALAAAHARGLVHRDIKPGNVILSPVGAKVVDFGIAAVAGARESIDGGVLWGTPAYLAPERLCGGEVVPASDVYALGLLLYRLLAGGSPWPVETVTQMLIAQQYREPSRLPPLTGVDPAVTDLCRRCLAKDPAERPDAAEAARVLAEASGWRVTSEAGGDIVIGAGTPLDLAAPDPGTVDVAAMMPAGDDAETVVVPPGAETVVVPPGDDTVVIPPGDDAETEGVAVAGRATRPRRLRTVTAVACALVVLALGLLTGFCAAGRDPERSEAHPQPPATGPTSPSTAADGAATGAGSGGGAGANGMPTAVGAPAAGAAGGQAGSVGGAAAGGGATGGGASGGNSGTGGGGGAPAPTAPAPAPPTTKPGKPGPTPVDRTFTTIGGTISARCIGSTATLTGYTPLAGFTPTQVRSGPGGSVGLVFDGVVTDVRVTVRCRDGVPVATII